MIFHFVGIGGVGMSVVAQILAAQGHTVSGSDRNDLPILSDIRTKGIKTFVGHDAAQVPADAILVVSSAVRKDNPEYKIAVARGQKIWHRSVALSFAGRAHKFVAVAGTHGKTTTTALLSMALIASGQDPSYAAGSSILQLGTAGHYGSDEMFVAEADESDGSFVNYRPSIAIITNQEPDHLDHHGTKEAVEQVFLDFAHCLVPGGIIICEIDCPGGYRLAIKALQLGLRVATYGKRNELSAEEYTQYVRYGVSDGTPQRDKTLQAQDEMARGDRVSPFSGALDIDWQLPVEANMEKECPSYQYMGHVKVVVNAGSQSGVFDFSQLRLSAVQRILANKQSRVAVKLGVPGAHNYLNAAGAWLAGLEIGQDPLRFAADLGAFTGTGRRFELVGKAAQVDVYDDYAHHPTEVLACITMAREVLGTRGKLLVLFEPLLYTRTRNFVQEFADAINLADQVVVTGVYGAREDPIAGVDGNIIVERMDPAISAEFVADKYDAARVLAGYAQAGDMVLAICGSPVNTCYPVIIEELLAKEGTK